MSEHLDGFETAYNRHFELETCLVSNIWQCY